MLVVSKQRCKAGSQMALEIGENSGPLYILESSQHRSEAMKVAKST